MAFRKPCDGCLIQNLVCDCDDDLKPPKRNQWRQWPPERRQPCACHLVPPFDRQKRQEYNLPKPPKNLKSLLEPLSERFTGDMTLNTIYMDSFQPKSAKKPKSFSKKELFVPSSQPMSGDTSSGLTYQYRIGEPAKLVRYCKRDILGKPKPICFTSTYQKDFKEKPDSRRKNFSKKMFFVPSQMPMNKKSLVEDSYVQHQTPKVTFVKNIEKIIQVDWKIPVGNTIYKTDFVRNKIEKRKEIPWMVYEKSRKKVSQGKVSHASEYKDNFVPISDPPTKLALPTGDLCRGNCECLRPGICLPNNLNLQGRAKLCDCHSIIDYCK